VSIAYVDRYHKRSLIFGVGCLSEPQSQNKYL
jgi:hypothetical protein